MWFYVLSKIFNYLKNDQTVLEADALAELSRKINGYYKHKGF